MTGPEHYREAERLIERADALVETAAAEHGQEDAVAGFHMTMARAQVHATLALAAASALNNRQNYDGPPGMAIEDQAGWDAVCKGKDVAW